MKKILFVGFATLDFIKGKRSLGGAAGIMSYNATYFSVNPYLLTVLSKDHFGKFYTEELVKAGVNLKYCNFDSPSIPTCIIDDVHGNGSERIWRDNNSLPFFDKLSYDKIPINQFDSIFLCNALPTVALRIAAGCKSRKIIYIPGPQTVIKPNYIKKAILSKTNIIIGNGEEAHFILRSRPFASGVKMMVITKGEKGGDIYFKNGKKINFDAPSIKKAVDTTGAGDNFSLGFSLALLKNKSVYLAIEFGKKLAKLTLSQKGGILTDKNAIIQIDAKSGRN